MREAGDEALVRCDIRCVQSDDFGRAHVVFGVQRALIHAHLQVKVGGLDAAEAIFAGILKLAALVAKQAAEVDLLSGGRLRLGVGTGWNHVEYDGLNEEFKNRGVRQEEQVALLRKLWAEPVVDFTGKFHRIDRAGFNPLPGRKIPIWFGGFADVAFRRAAEMGDGFIFGSSQEANLAAHVRVQHFLRQSQRDPTTFGIEAMLNYQAGEAQWRSDIEAWSEVGANYVSMRSQALRGMGDGLATPREHILALEKYWAVVGA